MWSNSLRVLFYLLLIINNNRAVYDSSSTARNSRDGATFPVTFYSIVKPANYLKPSLYDCESKLAVVVFRTNAVS